MKTIGIVGSRRRTHEKDYDKLHKVFFEHFENGDHIVSGGCPTGADSWAEYLARERGITIIIHHADWINHGKIAGLMRNGDIAKDADILIALVAEDRTGGTEDTIKKAKKLNKRIIIIDHENNVKELKPRKTLT